MAVKLSRIYKRGYSSTRYAATKQVTGVYQHTILAEKALGRPLPPKAVIHHYGKPTDNTRLVICPSQGYHLLLHVRIEAYRATGNANARRCRLCHKWGIPGDGDMVVVVRGSRPNGVGRAYHRSCDRLDCRQRYATGRKRALTNG